MKIKILAITVLVVSMTLTGCIAPHEPVVEATKQWEGRYSSLQSAAEALSKEVDTNNECQVWILQPSTLSRLLKNTEK